MKRRRVEVAENNALGVTTKNRKALRKEQKQLKKLRAQAFSKRTDLDTLLREKHQAEEKKLKKKAKKARQAEKRAAAVKSDEEKSASDDDDEEITYEEYMRQVEEKKHSRERSDAAANADDADIAKYGKLLGLNKRKNVAGAFASDGLDAILDLCDKFSSEPQPSKHEGDEEMEDDEDLDDEAMEEYGDDNDGDDLLEEDDDMDAESADEDGDEDGMDEEELEDEEEEQEQITEDIYGRRVNKATGQIIACDPQAAKQKLAALEETLDPTKRLAIEKTLTGLVNRLSEATLSKSRTTFEELWKLNPKGEVRQCALRVFIRVIGVPFRLQDELLSTYSALVAMLHRSLGSDFSSYFVEDLIKHYLSLITAEKLPDDNSLKNFTLFIGFLSVFSVIQYTLVVELMNKLVDSAGVEQLQMVQLLSTYMYPWFKRNCFQQFCAVLDRAAAMSSNEAVIASSRARFIIESLTAMKHSNSQTVDTSAIERQLKFLRSQFKEKASESTLGFSLDDLLNADERGRWWIVGSAYITAAQMGEVGGAATVAASAANGGGSKNNFSAKIIALATKAKMNTQTRKDVFCSVASANDEDDAFERVLKLRLHGQQERDIIYVLLQMFLLEKSLNLFYPTLVARFIEHNVRFQRTTQFAVWDRLKELGSMKPAARSHLAHFVHFLVSKEALPITVLKVIEWATLDSSTSSLLRRIFAELSSCGEARLRRIFAPLGAQRDDGKKRGGSNNDLLAEGIRLFLQVNFADNKVYSQKVLEWF